MGENVGLCRSQARAVHHEEEQHRRAEGVGLRKGGGKGLDRGQGRSRS